MASSRLVVVGHARRAVSCCVDSDTALVAPALVRSGPVRADTFAVARDASDPIHSTDLVAMTGDVEVVSSAPLASGERS